MNMEQPGDMVGTVAAGKMIKAIKVIKICRVLDTICGIQLSIRLGREQGSGGEEGIGVYLLLVGNGRWDKLSEWIKERPGTLVDHEFVDSYFPNRADYIEFVRDYLLD